jgi:hypothetical protein
VTDLIRTLGRDADFSRGRGLPALIFQGERGSARIRALAQLRRRTSAGWIESIGDNPRPVAIRTNAAGDPRQ